MRRKWLALGLALILALALCGVAQARDVESTEVDTWEGLKEVSGGGCTYN